MTQARRFSLIALIFAVAGGALFATARRADAADRTADARQLIKLLVKRDYAGVEKTFDGTMKQALPEAKLKAAWEGVVAQAGAFQKQGAARSQAVQQGGQSYQAVTIACQFADAAVDAKVVYNGQGQVSGLFFSPAGQ